MKQAKWFLIIAAVYLLGYLAHTFILQKTVYGDGIFYYSWVRSVIVDHDINFTNEYAHFGVNAPGNKHPIGAPLLWLPWYLQVHTIIGKTGYELPYQLVVGIISVLATLSGLILLFRLLTQSFSPTAGILAVLSIAGATNLLFYGAVDTVNSHAISFFAAVLFLSFLNSKRISPFLTGCTLGFCALVRPQDAVFGMIAYRKFSKAFFIGFIVSFFPQLLAWYLLYGSPFTSPYLSGGESFTWLPMHFFDVLLSPANGLFLWTPMTLVGLVGFIFWKRSPRVWFLLIFITEVAIIGSWSTWWQGASYSGRMLVSTIPILAFGLASLFTKLIALKLKNNQVLLSVIGPLSIINCILIIRFLLKT